MKKTIIAALAAGLAIGSFAGVHAKLPAVPPKSDAEKAAEADKAAAAKAKDAQELGQAQDRAVSNYKKNKGIEEPKTAAKPAAATTSGKK
jgi:hypothetical protein